MTPSAAISAQILQAVTIEGISHSLTTANAAVLQESFSGYFGDRVGLQDLIDAFERPGVDLNLHRLEIRSFSPDTFETRADFRDRRNEAYGVCRYLWRRREDGTLERSKDASLEINGSHNRLALQIHANLLDFSRRSGVVDDFAIEAREVGRYAYRLMDGVQIDSETLDDVAEMLAARGRYFGETPDMGRFRQLRSPRDVADFVVLSQIHPAWMTEVDDIVRRRGYRFTVDQMVDVARRPGLAFLLDRASYTMSLNLKNDSDYARFCESIVSGRSHETLQRIRGVLGIPYGQLPADIRNALIVHRPYLFPRPKKSPRIPDLSAVPQPTSPYRVLGYRSADGRFVPSIDPDPRGTPLRDYRTPEVRRVIRAIEDGVEIVTATGISGSGKTEALIWNLERSLSESGHRVISLDAQKLGGDIGGLLRRLDDVVQPTIVVFDESVYISGPRKEHFIAFAREFLKRPDQHIVFVGGGVISPEEQRIRIERNLEELWGLYRTAHVSLYPKPINMTQAYRFLGLARIDWADEAAKIGLLTYILERYPPYFIPMVPIRLHEHPEIASVEAAQRLIDAEVDVPLWTGAALMVFGDGNEGG